MNLLSIRKSPSNFRVKLRDKFLPRLRMRLQTSDGDLPFDCGDLVATQLRRGEFERAEISILTSVLGLCSTFVDVGANFGLYTLLASRRMRRGRIFSFEASPIEFDKLSWTIRKNDLTNVTAVHSAVSDELGEATIYESLFGAGALNRLDRPAKTTGRWRASRVPKISLDHYFALTPTSRVGRIDLIKIDVEGHELPVLLGAKDILRTSAPVIMIEVNASRMSDRSSPEQIFAFMRMHNYRMYAIDGATARLQAVESPSDKINYFAVSSSRTDALVSALLERSQL